mmetsp:Transcript_33009/g.77142  ORF Transcript_33009/g.77142 Transcript_33009/m.77142 type:complete len:657 (-) Transcript_33009:15-1985(-)
MEPGQGATDAGTDVDSTDDEPQRGHGEPAATTVSSEGPGGPMGSAVHSPQRSSAPATKVSSPTGQDGESKVAGFHKWSRLHFLGTWRERFDQWRQSKAANAGLLAADVRSSLAAEMARFSMASEASSSSSAPAPAAAGSSSSMWALLDMDCFFVSVATRDEPGGSSVPTAVVSSCAASGEICSANYAARAHGVNTHLWSVERALEKLPTIRLIPISEAMLRAVESTWQQVHQLLVLACLDSADRVQMRSCDEAFLEVPPSCSLEPEKWAEALRKAVFAQTRCTCSIGIASSQVVAKMAGKKAKPDGFCRVSAGEEEEFMSDIPLEQLPQVGRSLAAKLADKQLHCCRDLLSCSKQQMQQWFGARGEQLLLWSRGQDAQDVSRVAPRRTMSAEINFGVRLQDFAGAEALLDDVVQQLNKRLEGSKLLVQHITLKLKIAVVGWSEPIKVGGHGACEDVSRSAAMPRSSRETASLYRVAAALLKAVNPDPLRIRGMGLAAKVQDEEALRQNPLSKWLQSAQQPGAAEKRIRSVESKEATANGTPAAMLRQNVIDLADSSEDEEQAEASKKRRTSSEAAGSSEQVACPVCGLLQPLATADAHVNSHFDSSAAPVPALLSSSQGQSKGQVSVPRAGLVAAEGKTKSTTCAQRSVVSCFASG